jgi:hypothetical protein
MSLFLVFFLRVVIGGFAVFLRGGWDKARF